jgi:hypothetical protein
MVIAEPMQVASLRERHQLHAVGGGQDRNITGAASLQALASIDGRNIMVIDRWAAARNDRVPELVAEVIRSDSKSGYGLPHRGTIAAVQVSRTVPIVLVGASDLVAPGIVDAWHVRTAMLPALSIWSCRLHCCILAEIE